MPFEVETRSLDGQATAVGAAGPYTVVIDRPAGAGGGGLGFNRGHDTGLTAVVANSRSSRGQLSL